LLHSRGFRFRKDHPVDTGDRTVRPDIVFTKQKVAVFVDGCFWHLCPDHGRIPGGKNATYWEAKLIGNSRRDMEDNRRLEQNGWRVVRFWEHTALTTAADVIGREVHSRQEC
jgi:DNA mismatch endonuclease (patch repair protein)